MWRVESGGVDEQLRAAQRSGARRGVAQVAHDCRPLARHGVQPRDLETVGGEPSRDSRAHQAASAGDDDSLHAPETYAGAGSGRAS
jgi:hypothetical protein